MDPLKHVIVELHRRSIWQVLSIYLVGSWGALEVVDGVTANAGLPDWVPPFALVLLVIGLPIVLATAFVQEGMPGSGSDRTEPVPAPAASGPERVGAQSDGVRGLFTWRNAVGGGVGAGLLLATAVVAYFVMRVTGIGPVASLAAQGVIEAGEPIILAEFGNTSNDPSLARVVTEALRVDLGSSQALTLVEEGRVRETLGRMQRDPATPLTADVAAEVAVREGIKAVIDGEVGSAGSGYILVATLRDADSGAPLATFRRTAAGPDDVIQAIDGLSQDIREKAGESLRTIKGEPPLMAVTTSSLQALRLTTEAESLSETGEETRAKELLERALELDPEFAMAWRKLAVVLATAGEDEPGQRQAAAKRAWELRDRLTERERYLATAYYHQEVTGDLDAQMRAYQGVLDKYPDDRASLNNLSIVFQSLTRYEDALALLERAVGGPGSSSPAYTNWVVVLAYLGRTDEARAALDSMNAVYPDRSEWSLFDEWQVTAIDGDIEGATAAARALMTAPDVNAGWRAAAEWELAVTDAMQGHLAASRARLEDIGARALAEGRDRDAWVRVTLAQIQRMVYADPAEAVRTLEAYLGADDRLSYPPEVDRYVNLVRDLAFTGQLSAARAVLDEWQERSAGATDALIRQGRRTVAALESLDTDPGGTLASLDRLVSEFGCPRCLHWERDEIAERAGDLTRAEALYVESLAVADDFSTFPLYRVMGHERLGRVYEAMGRNREASAHYARFAELWSDADPELQPRVRAAREKAATLAASVGED